MPQPKNDLINAYAEFNEKLGMAKMAIDSSKLTPEERAKYENSYDIFTDEEKGYHYNIVELAHPEPAVVALPWDPVLGLVDNVNEKQNIILHKIMRFPTEFNFPAIKTASGAALAKNLIRIGNDMDIADEEELRVLADECLMELRKDAQWYKDLYDKGREFFGNSVDKTVTDVGSVGEGALVGAASGAAIGALLTIWFPPASVVGAGSGALVGAAIGAISAGLFATSPAVKNIKTNSKDLLYQLSDLKKSVPGESGYFKKVEDAVAKILGSSDRYMAAVNIVKDKYTDNKEPYPYEVQGIVDVAKEFKADMVTIRKIREEFERKEATGVFAAAKGGFLSHFIDDDIEDVQKSFLSLQSAIDNLDHAMDSLGKKAVSEAVKPEEKPAAKPEEKPANKPEAPAAPTGDDKYNVFQNPPGAGMTEEQKAFMESIQ